MVAAIFSLFAPPICREKMLMLADLVADMFIALESSPLCMRFSVWHAPWY